MPAQAPTLRRILVVDDDRIMRELLALMLDGEDVRFAQSGDQALTLLTEGENFDVILTDLHMPGLHGLALAEGLRALVNDRCVLIGMSGSEPGEQERAAFHVFLQKPFTAEQLHEAFEHEALEHGIAATVPDAAMQAALSSMPLPRHAPLDEAVFDRLSALMSADQMHKLYHMTLHDVQRRILRMKSAAECGDEKTYREEAHSIKGGCGMVGAAELSALAALAEQDVQTSSTIFSQFDSAFARLQGMLETRIGS